MALQSGRFWRLWREWLSAVLGLAALVVGIMVYREETRLRPRTLTITAGSPEGLRHQIALRLARAAAREGITLVVVGTPGSEEALNRVNLGTLDLALVQGGLDHATREHVRQVAPLKIEPLHLIAKEELLPKEGDPTGLKFLRGRKVNVGSPGSGTSGLTREVLEFAGIQGDVTATTLSYDALLRETDRGKLPDAIFTVSALPSPVVRRLVTRQRYRLVPLHFGEAFSLDALHEPPSLPHEDAPPSSGATAVDRIHIYRCEIPAYTYGVSPPTPPEPIPTFGTRLLLVGSDRAESRAISRLLEAAYANGPGGPVLDSALLEIAPELDWHPGALEYRERIKPLFIGDAIDFLEKGTSLTGAMLGAVFFLWQWYRQHSRRRRERGFESYMLKVAEIEQTALKLELAQAIDLKELLRLRLDLYGLKDEALRKFAAGELEGEELISGFLTHVNDARDHLTRLLLHERENLEDEAAREGRPVAALWQETVGTLADPPPPTVSP